MCEQCVTDAVFYALAADGKVEEALPGWHLMRAQKDGGSLTAGQWGLVRCNDPDFVWSEPPVPDPYEGLTDEQINNASEEMQKADRAFSDAAIAFESALKVEAELGYEIVSAALKAGFDRKKHGRLGYWLFDHLGRWILNHQPIHHADERFAVSH